MHIRPISACHLHPTDSRGTSEGGGRPDPEVVLQTCHAPASADNVLFATLTAPASVAQLSLTPGRAVHGMAESTGHRQKRAVEMSPRALPLHKIKRVPMPMI